MQPWVSAWVLGTFSGLSLPIGAFLGILLSPVRDTICAAWMALGAGALLFAVTVELYGHALRELELGRAGLLEIFSTVAGALAGAMFYLVVNRWLEQAMEEPEEIDAKYEDSPDTSAPLEDGGQSLSPSATILSPRAPSENTPLYRKNAPHTLGITSSLADERRRWEQMTTPAGRSHREDSFSRWSSFAVSEDYSIKSRGRDRVFNRISGASGSRSPSKPRTSTTPNSPGDSICQVDPAMAQKGTKVAFALFLGILVDGVPEGLLMGFLAAEGHLSKVLVISLLVANFPEAFSSASLMRQGGVGPVKIVGMWTGLCIAVGALAGFSCFLLKYFFPSYPGGADLPHSLIITVAIIEGVTGGAMIACIATVMLPEAFMRAGREGSLCFSSGFLTTAGFLSAVVLKALEHHYNNTHGHVPAVYGHAFYVPGHGYW